MKKETVLLVDDTSALLKLAAAIFESGGYNVITATDGAEALNELSSHNVNLIITDILMPNMDGYSLCFNVRNHKKYSRIPIIIYSATYTSQSDERMALDIGADLFIRKPAGMDFLLNAAKELISKPKEEPVQIDGIHELSDVMKQYNSRLVEKLEEKNGELQQVHEELIRNEQKFQHTLDNMLEGAQIHDDDWRYIYVNNAAARYSTYTKEELIGHTLIEKYPGIEHTELFRTMQRCKTERTAVRLETELALPNGTIAYFELSIEPIPEGIFILSVDRTEQKRAEEEKIKMITDIVQRNKDLEQFSYIVSHNLRLPVANIIGLTDLLIAEEDAGQRPLIIEGLAISTGKLDLVIKDLNEVLQIHHQVSEVRERVMFSELLMDIQLSIGTLLRDENVTIVSDFKEVSEIITIRAYLYSIFFNLISNSIKYRKPGVQSCIEIISHAENNSVALIFKDNGLGLDLEKASTHIFGLYQRFHTHVEGRGVGLFMVKTQIEALRGKITVESEVGKGASFTILLPVS